MSEVIVLYEDSRQRGQPRLYGPHLLVLRYLADVTGHEMWRLEQAVVAVPCNNSSKLRAKCVRDLPRLAARGQAVVATYDADKIRDLVKLGSTACITEVKAALTAVFPGAHLRIALLDRNLETMLRHLRICAPSLVSDVQWDAAIIHKKLMDRDTICQRAATANAAAARRCLVERMPSFAYLLCQVWRAYVGATRE